MSPNPFFGGQGGRTELECIPLVHLNTLEKPSPLRIIKKKSRLDSRPSHQDRRGVVSSGMTKARAPSVSDCLTPTKHIPSNLQPWLQSIRSAEIPQFQYTNRNIVARANYQDAQNHATIETRHSSSQSSNSYEGASFPNSSGFSNNRTRDTSLEFEQSRLIGSDGLMRQTSLGDDQDMGFQGILPQVLAPHVDITTNTGGLLYDGSEYIWAAVEISGKLSHTYSADAVPNTTTSFDNATSDAIDDQLDCFFKHGRLYDLSVEILSSSDTEISQVLHHHKFPTAIYSGSTILLLVKVRFCQQWYTSYPITGHDKPRSDQLIEDLESQLGNTSVPYMQIRITYSHSAFAEYSETLCPNGVSYLSSRLETTATASLKRHNRQSNWCSPPLANTDALFEVMKRHWDIERASRIFEQIQSQKGVNPSLTPRHTSSCRVDGTSLSPSNFPSQLSPPRLSLKETIQLSKKRVSGKSRRTVSQAPQRTEPEDHKVTKRRSLGNEFLRGLMPAFGGLSVEYDERCLTNELSGTPIFAQSRKDAWVWDWGSWF
ncbi:hypothetical protein VHEMI03529 [[Torrubiella] hemipterigena]|uniref:Uncharacterized protein n=1 Tax=[Torrubiella] hemipterigena TaxID=1531966 RepID=A0A0A1SYR5_9HYPO|nr:hypothetical protein VHEMI03529 [[Torrubiella] hemipterigena]